MVLFASVTHTGGSTHSGRGTLSPRILVWPPLPLCPMNHLGNSNNKNSDPLCCSSVSLFASEKPYSFPFLTLLLLVLPMALTHSLCLFLLTPSVVRTVYLNKGRSEWTKELGTSGFGEASERLRHAAHLPLLWSTVPLRGFELHRLPS